MCLLSRAFHVLCAVTKTVRLIYYNNKVLIGLDSQVLMDYNTRCRLLNKQHFVTVKY